MADPTKTTNTPRVADPDLPPSIPAITGDGGATTSSSDVLPKGKAPDKAGKPAKPPSDADARPRPALQQSDEPRVSRMGIEDLRALAADLLPFILDELRAKGPLRGAPPSSEEGTGTETAETIEAQDDLTVDDADLAFLARALTDRQLATIEALRRGNDELNELARQGIGPGTHWIALARFPLSSPGKARQIILPNQRIPVADLSDAQVTELKAKGLIRAPGAASDARQ